MTGPTTKGEATRQHILQTATRVFAEKGYAGARMDDIIQASGLTKGAIYFHFASKFALAQAVVDAHKENWLSLGVKEIARHPTPRAQLHSLGQFLIALASNSSDDWNTVRLAEQLRNSEEGKGESPADRCDPLQAWVTLVTDIVLAGQESGEFTSSVSASDAGVIIVAAFDGLKTTHDTLFPGAMESYVRQARILLEGFEAQLTN